MSAIASPDQKLLINFQLEPIADGDCPISVNDLLRHIVDKLRGQVTMPFEFSKWIVSAEQPTADQKTLAWLRVDERTSAFLGLFLWNTTVGEWQRGAAVGERITKVRTESTVAKDRKKWGLLAGWELANGKAAGVADLTKEIDVSLKGGKVTIDDVEHDVTGLTGTIPSPWFSGSAPDWDVYTVVKVAS